MIHEGSSRTRAKEARHSSHVRHQSWDVLLRLTIDALAVQYPRVQSKPS